MKTTIFESALKNPKSYLSLRDEAAAILLPVLKKDGKLMSIFRDSDFGEQAFLSSCGQKLFKNIFKIIDMMFF